MEGGAARGCAAAAALLTYARTLNITDAVMHKFLQMWFIADFLDFLMVILCIDKSNSPNHNHSTHEFQNLFLNDFLHKSLMLPPV